MSRKSLLLQKTGAYFHVFNRGTNREQIFFTPNGYALFLTLIRERLQSTALALHAYCLMPNHFHLILRQDEPYALSRFMKGVCEPYAKAINGWLHRTGHVFERRYRLRHIDDPAYLLQVSRYVHLNPVEARFVDSPVAWLYSSCMEYCGARESPYVDTEAILSQAGGQDGYLAFLGKGRQVYTEGSTKFLIDWAGAQEHRHMGGGITASHKVNAPDWR